MWAGYVRVSQVAGRSGDSFRSPGDQAAAIKAWAKARGAEVEVLAPELDESGGRVDRPILTQAIAGIESGRYEGLVAYDQSRIMRDTVELLGLVDRIFAAGGKIATVNDDVDWLTSTGRMFGTFKAALDEHTRLAHRERFAQVTAAATAGGIWQRRQIPRGYARDPKTRQLVPGKDAPTVRRAFKDRLAGVSISTIATRMGMTPSGLKRLLANRLYLGELHVAGNVNRAAHPPLVDLATFNGVQALMGARPSRGAARSSVLAGLVRCEGCSHAMARNFTGRYGGTYRCAIHHAEGVCPRPAGITGDILDRFVEQVAIGELEQLRVRASARTEDIAALRDDVARAEAELAAYLEATSAADLGGDVFAEGARTRKRALEQARQALAEREVVTPLAAAISSGADAWRSLDVQRRNHVLRGLLDAVVVRAVGRGNKVEVADRVRVFAHGTLHEFRYRGGAISLPVVPMPFPDRDDERLLGERRGEGAGEGVGG